MAEVKEFEYEFNPIKENKNGLDDKVVWSTKALIAAVDGINKGLPLKSNPFCGKNVNLLKPDLVYMRTKEEVDDYVKCMQDPIYFASKCFLMTPEGLQPVKLRDYQEDYLTLLKNNRFTIFKSCRQSGKCQTLDSKVLIKIDKDVLPDDTLRKLSYYYIKDNIYNIPLFELYNIYCKQTILWKINYLLYKLIYKIKLWQAKKDQYITD